MEILYSLLVITCIFILLLIIEAYRKGAPDNLLSEQSNDLSYYNKAHLSNEENFSQELDSRKAGSKHSTAFKPKDKLY